MATDDSESESETEPDPNSTKKPKKSDPAIYKASSDPRNEGPLFTMPAAWNTFSIVLRDSGVLKFVKYVSQSAKGDRWDVVGAWSVNSYNEGDTGEKQEGNSGGSEKGEEEEWRGIEIDNEESEDEGEGGAGNVGTEDDDDEEYEEE